MSPRTGTARARRTKVQPAKCPSVRDGPLAALALAFAWSKRTAASKGSTPPRQCRTRMLAWLIISLVGGVPRQVVQCNRRYIGLVSQGFDSHLKGVINYLTLYKPHRCTVGNHPYLIAGGARAVRDSLDSIAV